MTYPKVDRENFKESLNFALTLCRNELENSEQKNSQLVRDIKIGLQSLDLIYKEVNGTNLRPKGERSAGFTRYVIDEENRMAMDSSMRELIVQIESIYKKFNVPVVLKITDEIKGNQ